MTAAPKIDIRIEAQEAIRLLIDRVAFIALTLGLVSAILGVLRITAGGPTPNVVIDVIVYAIIVVIIFLRHRIPIRVTLVLLLSVVGMSALANFVTLGLATVGFVMLSTCVVVAGAAFNVRAGIVAAALGAVAVLGIAWFVTTGRTPGSHITMTYLMSPLTWIMQTVTFAVYSAVMLASVSAIQRRLTRSLAETKRQSEELREREKKYRLLAENMDDVVVVQDLDGRFLYVSPSIERLFGYTVDEAGTLRQEDIITPETLSPGMSTFHSDLEKARNGNVSSPLIELECIRKDGSRFWGEYKPSFLFDDSGGIVAIQGVLRDISERKNAEQKRRELELQLNQSERLQAIGRLAGGIAHDFNNQLTGIMAYADLLRRLETGNSEVAEYAENILAPARRAAELTSKLLAFARKGAYENVPVDLHSIIEETIAILEHSLDKTITLVRHFEARSAVIMGDATQLQSALLNLALNARDAMPRGGTLTFSTRSAVALTETDLNGSGVEITVADTGTGIDPSIVDHIFDPFFTTKEVDKGNGLGLAAVYGTVQSHGGAISVTSEPGAGTTFDLRFPLDLQTVKPSRQAPAAEPVTGKGKLLVIDDDPAVAQSLAAMLTRLGYKTDSCLDARKAIEKYENSWRDIDMIVQDMKMPHIPGEVLFGELRRINPRARILLVSGYAIDSSIRSLLDKGAAGFLKKPFTMAELSLKITECLVAKL